MPPDCRSDVCTSIRAQDAILPHGACDPRKIHVGVNLNNEE
jgi:hypothetical protein